MQDSSSFWKLLSHLGYIGMCISKSQDIIWTNTKAKRLFGDYDKFDMSIFKKVFRGEDDWLLSKCIMDSMKGQYVHKIFELKNNTKYSMLEFHFLPLELDEGSSGQGVVILANESTKARNNEKISRKIQEYQMRATYNQCLEAGHKIIKQNWQDEMMAWEGGELKHLVENLLGLYPQDENQDKENIALTSIIDKVMTNWQPAFTKYQIRLKVCKFPADLKVFGCSVDFEKSLMILMSHSYEAIKRQKQENPDEIEFWLAVEYNESRGDVDLFFTYSGKKMGRASQESLFQAMFHEVSEDHALETGLVTAYGLIEKNGGKVRTDTRHQFTRFVLTFPKLQVSRKAA